MSWKSIALKADYSWVETDCLGYPCCIDESRGGASRAETKYDLVIPIDSNKAIVEMHMYDPAESYASRSLIAMPRGRDISNRTIDAIER